MGAFPLRKKPGNFVGSKSGISVVPFGRKPRYVAGCPTVDLELVQTTRNVNGTRHSVRKFQPGKREHLFRFFTFSGNFPVGRTDETCSIYRRTGNSGNFDYMESAPCFHLTFHSCRSNKVNPFLSTVFLMLLPF